MRVWHWLVIVILLAILVVGVWWWRRSSSSASKDDNLHLKPKVGLVSMNITEIDEDRIKGTSRLVLSNPLPLDLKTNRLNYEIFIDSVKVIKSSYDKPFSIRSSDSTTLEMPVEILTKKMEALLKHFDKIKQDSADYTMKSSFVADVPVAGERTFTMSLTKRLPAIRIPTVKPGKLNIDKLGLKNSVLEMEMLVVNPNAFPLKMKDGRYTMVIDNKMKMEGVMEKIVNVPARGAEPITMHLDIKTVKMGKLAWNFLFEKKNTDFRLDFSCRMISDNEMLKNSKMAFKMQGTLDDLKKLQN